MAQLNISTFSPGTYERNSYTLQVPDDYKIPPMAPGAWVEFQDHTHARLALYANNIESVLLTHDPIHGGTA